MSESNKNSYLYAKIKYMNRKMFVTIHTINEKPKSINVSLFHEGRESVGGFNYDNYYEFNKVDENKSVEELLKHALRKTELFSRDGSDDDEIEHYIKQLKPLLDTKASRFDRKCKVIEPLRTTKTI